MSVHVSSRVWRDCPQTGSKRLMMLALADFCNDAGECWPSIGSLVERTRLSERNVRYVLDALERDGELVRERHPGRGHTTRYLLGRYADGMGANIAPISRERVQPVAPIASPERVQPSAERVQPSAERVQVATGKGAIAVAPDPLRGTINEPSEEPSEETTSPAPPKRQRKASVPADPALAPLKLAVMSWFGFGDGTGASKAAHINADALAKIYLAAGETPADVEADAAAWFSEDWRGRKGETPTTRTAAQDFRAKRRNGRANGHGQPQRAGNQDGVIHKDGKVYRDYGFGTEPVLIEPEEWNAY